MKTNLYKTYIKLLAAFFLFTMFAASCGKDPNPVDEPPINGNEEETITTLRLTFTDSTNAGNTFSVTFSDPDGDGGNGPVAFDTIRLDSGKVYNVSTTVSDESKTPAVDLTSEVQTEANDHMLFYKPVGAGISISYQDQDTNNPPLPLGLSTKWRATTVGSGTVQVILKHQPGTKNGTETPGETDIDVTFQARVQ